jgi:TolA-binding protein
MSSPSKRSGYVSANIDAARIEAQWERISRRLPTQRVAARGYGIFTSPRMGMAVVALCALGVLWWNRTPRASMKQGVDSGWAGSLVASDDAPITFKLAEGTNIDVDPNSQLELLRNGDDVVAMALARGAARFDVAKRPGRRFSVQAGAIEVVVTGTQFYLSRRPTAEGERMHVSVQEGTVEVNRSGKAVAVLHRGEQWSGIEQSDDFRLRQIDESADLPEELRTDESPEDDLDSTVEGPRRRRRRHVAPEHAPSVEPAAQLFEQANELRRAGELRESAKLFAQLVQSYPKDRRAALSAFELGRLRMDSLGDVPGAVEALEGALKLDSRRSFAEDALARLVTAHEAQRSRESCVRARDRYLSRYPDGVHAARLAKSCTTLP